jgi:lysozyme
MTFYFLLGVGILLMTMTRLTKSGLDKIKEHEALRLHPYRDTGGRWTIGWGHLIRESEPNLMRPEGITHAEAESILRGDLLTAEQAVSGYVTAPLTSGQYDALVSLVFNIGAGAFAGSTLLKKLNAGDYVGAAEEFPKWRLDNGVVVAGLEVRRLNEQQTFLS